MGKKQISESEEEYEEQKQEEIEDMNEQEENLEEEEEDGRKFNDSFDKKNNDILDGSSEESEKDEINAWGTDRKRFYKMNEEVSLNKIIFIYFIFDIFIMA